MATSVIPITGSNGHHANFFDSIFGREPAFRQCPFLPVSPDLVAVKSVQIHLIYRVHFASFMLVLVVMESSLLFHTLVVTVSELLNRD